VSNPFGEDALWQRVYEIACRVARAQFHLSVADAEEIGQEMLLRAFRQTRRATINVSWICQGARFACIDRIRAIHAEEQAMARYGRECRTTDLFSPAAISPADLRAALRKLPTACQQLIHRYYWEGLTWAELDDAVARGHRCAQYETRKCVQRLAQTLYQKGPSHAPAPQGSANGV
jgi:DNA-directed RNA polymerase specialized sigma24 family protein